MLRKARNLLKSLFSPQAGFILFWLWNFFFCCTVAMGYAPLVLINLIPAAYEGLIPGNMLIYAIIILAIPFVFVYFGAKHFNTNERKKDLFGLLYGVQWPLMLLLCFRFFGIKQLTPLMMFVFIVAGIAITIYSWQLFDSGIEKWGKWLTGTRLMGMTAMLMLGLYFVAWPSFFIPPAIKVFVIDFIPEIPDIIGEIFSEIQYMGWDSLYIIPMMLGTLAIVSFSMLIFGLLPIVVPIIYGRAYLRGWRDSVTRLGRPISLGITGVTAAFLVVMFLNLSQQRQLDAYELLQEPPQTIEEARSLQQNEEMIRAGLVNAYLGAYRYTGAMSPENSSAYEAWRPYTDYGVEKTMYGVSDETAFKIGQLYNRIITPLNYQPMDECDSRWRCFREEADDAAVLYQSYFDEPINEGEKDVIVDAVRQTWNPDVAMSQWQAVDDREVWMEEQHVNITERGDWAEVEIHEVYRNQTFDNGEVVYFLSLPESAVITSVWLGTDEGKQFEHVVAPRGAAQQVYQEQVQVTRQDPALAEQIGITQYRLRIYPVPPKTQTWERDDQFTGTLADGDNLHLWLTYSVMGTEAGWPMPTITEKRNIYWTWQSDRTLNGKKLRGNDWLPEFVKTDNFTPQPHRVDLPNGETVIAMPTDESIAQVTFSKADGKYAFVLDRSYSMREVADEVGETIQIIAESVYDYDIYLTAADNRGEEPFVESSLYSSSYPPPHFGEIFYFGSQHSAELLSQFDELSNDSRPYDAVFVITDNSGYELGEVEFDVPQIDIPIWMVHLNGAPIGYDDATLELIQASGGGATTSIEEAFTRYTYSLAGEADRYDGYEWRTVETADVDGLEHDPAFAQIAARRYILSEMMANRGDLSDVDQLRDIHAIAVENDIVTPYSSMIVLVNQRQLDRLNELSEQDDAFEREFEEVGQTEQMQMQAVATPEPHEWVLIITAVVLFGTYLHYNRQQRGLA